MKKTDCIHANVCESNCGICNRFVSTEPKIRTELVMALVNLTNEVFNKNDIIMKQELFKLTIALNLTIKEYELFNFESQNGGV